MKAVQVFGTFREDETLVRAMQSLHEAGFPQDDVSVFKRKADPEIEQPEDLPRSGALAGAGAGAIFGGALGWLLAAADLAFPGSGTVLNAGPAVAALVGAGLGAGVGGLAGALLVWGTPGRELSPEEERGAASNAFVSIYCETDDEEEEALTILRRENGRNVSSVNARLRPHTGLAVDRRTMIPTALSWRHKDEAQRGRSNGPRH